MAKTKKFLCTFLSTLLFVGMISVNVSARPVDKWEEIFCYADKTSPYIIQVYQTVYRGIVKNEVKYKFVAYETDTMSKVEYVTNPYTLVEEERNYDLTDDTKQYEILLKAIKNDGYLEISFRKRSSIVNDLRGEDDCSATHLCYDCYDRTIMSYVCRSCGNDTFTMKGKNYICAKCNKNNYTSLRKKVCAKCKGTNIESIDAYWQIVTSKYLEDVHQSCSLENTGVYALTQQMLSDNWNEYYADKYQLDWQSALDIPETKRSSELIFDIAENQKQVATEFSKKEPFELKAKYEALATEKCIGAIADGLNGIAGEIVNNKNLLEIFEKVFGEKDKAVEFAESIDSAKTEEEMFDVLQKYNEAELKGILKGSIEELSNTDLIKEYLSLFDGVIDLGVLNEVKELCDLSNMIAGDYTEFYEKYYAILNGSSVKSMYIQRLYNEIVLATTIRNAIG